MALGILKAIGKLASRARKRGDDTYNARRRFTRRAKRLEKQAAKETGATAERLRLQAESNYKKALETYENQKDAAAFAKKHGLEAPARETTPQRRQYLIEQSKKTTERALKDPEIRRETAARELMNTRIGSRILAATKELWIDDTGERVDPSEIYPKLFEAFNVDNLSDLVGIFEEELGEELYLEPDSEARYDEVVAAGKRFVRAMRRNAR